MLLFISSKKLLGSSFTTSVFRLFKYRKMSSVPEVLVKTLDPEEKMKISFEFRYSDFPVQKFSFERSKNERLAAALVRMKSKIQTSVLQKAAKKKRKKNISDVVEEVLPSLNIALLKNGSTVDENCKNIDAWTPDNMLVINEEIYKIIFNPPTVSSISLPKCIISRTLIYPKVTLEFCSKEDCIFKWYRQVIGDISDDDETVLKINKISWKFICQNFWYTSNEQDIGCKLRVSCTPKMQDKTGREEVAVSENTVKGGPAKFPFEDRHQHTKELTSVGSYRFVSYNILADCYADTETARKELFAHCPGEYLDIEYRRPLYLKEILGYNADVICLQEVDKRIFHEDLVPVLGTVGLKGIFDEKDGNVSEGVACFYRDTKLKLIESHSIILSKVIKTEEVLQKIYSKISENEKLLERFTTRTSALQVTLLECLDVPRKRILIGNTHLYFHPESDNIRLLQGACCLLYLEKTLKKYQEMDPSYKISLVLSGDFNSVPECGVFKLATEGFLPSSCVDWESNAEEKVPSIDLDHSLQLKSACGMPPYTNFTKGFFGCLDYIFYDKSLFKVSQKVPLPTHEQVIEQIALPNQVFPSDHIALVCSLSWK